MLKQIALASALITVIGCADMRPTNPTGDARGEVARVYVSIEALARQVGQAQQAGYIGTVEEERLLKMLEAAIVAASVVEASTAEAETEEKLAEIRSILDTVKQSLREETYDDAS